ncbi:hypothetical protein QZH41_020416, partial [Actinostola sp. cb2023]
DATLEEKHEFLREIEFMKNVGCHRNIISMVACCTKEEHVFLVVEFAKHGDLLNLLRERRKKIRCPEYEDQELSIEDEDVKQHNENLLNDLISISWQIATGMILPRQIVKLVSSNGARLAHIYGLPKTHKVELAMRPILSATGTYNFKLAKWLDEKLKPLSVNDHTITDVFQFADYLHQAELNVGDTLVSYDVCSLFTNVPLDETIDILVDKAFKDNWFNSTYDLDISKKDLKQLLLISTKNQLFQFEGNLYERTEGVAMGSPLGPLMANTFMCSIEDRLIQMGQLPSFYNRYVDDTLVAMPNVEVALSFLNTLNTLHPSLEFTMETAQDNKLPFLGMLITKTGCHLSTEVYRKPTDTGLLLHFKSHVDIAYKRALLKQCYIVLSVFHLHGSYLVTNVIASKELSPNSRP